MEEAKPSNSGPNSPGGGCSLEARFTELCKGLALGEVVQKDAMTVFKESKSSIAASLSSFGSQPVEEVQSYCSAFILYCVSRLSKEKMGEEEGRVTLCQILRVAKLNLLDFFKDIAQFCLKVECVFSSMYGPDWQKRLELKELQENVMQLIDLSKFYNKSYMELFLPVISTSDQNATVSVSTSKILGFRRFGWLLFLALRVHYIGQHKNLVTCTNGLVAILAILILHVPIQFRKFSIQDSSRFGKQSDKGVNLLASLCDIYHTSEDDLRRAIEKANSLIVDILGQKPCQDAEAKAENLSHINTDGLLYFEDLLEDKSLESNLAILEKDYTSALNTKCELDERLFIDDEDCLVGDPSMHGSADINEKIVKFTPTTRMVSQPAPRSPSSPRTVDPACFSNFVPVTPVRTAMSTAKWLRDIIYPLSSKPSSKLEHLFSQCDQNVSSSITRRADIILEAIFPSSSFRERCISVSLQSANMSEDIAWARDRKMEALKLYFRVLEAVCHAESQLPGSHNLTALLLNEQFHRCMLACSAELVLATHKTVILMFPAVLERTGLTAFDLSKVIEIFIRHEETLPRELKRHLNSLEERLLESMAWEKGSSLYNSMILAMPAHAVEINSLMLLAEPMPSLDAIAIHHDIPIGGYHLETSETSGSLADHDDDTQHPNRLCNDYRTLIPQYSSFTSPVKERLLTFNSLKAKSPSLQLTFASPSQPKSGGSGSCADTAIKVFFNKILKLAAVRIRSLCESLELYSQITEHVYGLFQKVLNQRTTLFFNRHIDQIILCSLYGVSKVSSIGLTFRSIINSYKKQPQYKPQVFRSIFVGVPSATGNGRMVQEHVDIIAFYNQVYIPSVKPLLVELVPTRISMDDKSGVDGKAPCSPKLSPFPKLPDMSPKKVSAAHNVYVSPLRQTKMDTLLSPSSRSYYACIGESTHAYQSPSSDLKAINNRLNCDRRVNGRLNFDVVSDSVVARALGYENGASASTDDAVMLNLPMKRKQPDDP